MIHLPILSKKGVVQSKFYAHTQCLKITENVSFNIASESSYVYILSGQKFKKMPKMVNFGDFFKIAKCDILGNFQTLCTHVVLFFKATFFLLNFFSHQTCKEDREGARENYYFISINC